MDAEWSQADGGKPRGKVAMLQIATLEATILLRMNKFDCPTNLKTILFDPRLVLVIYKHRPTEI